jgi:hypothetical protein
VVGACEGSGAPSGSIKRGAFFDILRNCQLLRKDSAS